MNNDDDSEFARLIPGVKRLQNDRVNVYRQRDQNKSASVRDKREIQQRADPQVLQPSDSVPARESHFHSGLQKKLQRKIRQGLIRPETSIDLHGYRQTEALEVLEVFLSNALRDRMRMVLIVHGQGFRSQSDAVLKPLVRRWLSTQAQVLAWCPAIAEDGAAGASYVYLRNK
ncbi:MAG: hypothetical protein GY935_18095 [Gammaproteobacteria bacterium]|nr:hypothetical protein [Gammaproteobacteria bacterium]